MEFTYEDLPQIKDISEEDKQTTLDMLSALWHNYSNNSGSTSLPYWMDKFSTHTEANKTFMSLSQIDLIKTSVPKKNYATLELDEAYLLKQYTREEIFEIIRETRLDTYAPTRKPDANKTSNNTKLASGIQDTGIKREGFAKAGTHSFQYDIPMMIKYKKEIVEFSIKSMKKLEEELGTKLKTIEGVDYESTIHDTIDYIIDNPETYFYLGRLTNDSRGRAIYQCLKAIFNPIANKMARALVKTPKNQATPSDVEHAYLFVEELVGGFDGDITRKKSDGRIAQILHEYHSDVPLDDMYENIWLERLYADLDAYEYDHSHSFTVPLEIDFSASNMAIIGLLLGHSDYIDHTQYMWEIDGLSKLHVKSAQTPYVFGSSATIPSLWKKAKLDFTTEQVLIMKQEQLHGKYSFANRLKDIIIDHCNPEAEMYLNVDNEIAKVECNRYKWVAGDEEGSTLAKTYIVYDSEADTMKIVTNKKSHKVADLDRFKRYFPTSLVHRCDGMIMDGMCLPMSWIIPIHDAGLVMVSEASKFKDEAVTQMTYFHNRRKELMHNFLTSINLDSEGWYKYAKLLSDVEEANKNKEINIVPWLLK